MMHKLGHNVIHYGHDKSDVICSEHVSVIDDLTLKRTYNESNYTTIPEYDTINDLAFQVFYLNTERELRSRAKQRRFCFTFFWMGTQNTM